MCVFVCVWLVSCGRCCVDGVLCFVVVALADQRSLRSRIKKTSRLCSAPTAPPKAKIT